MTRSEMKNAAGWSLIGGIATKPMPGNSERVVFRKIETARSRYHRRSELHQIHDGLHADRTRFAHPGLEKIVEAAANGSAKSKSITAKPPAKRPKLSRIWRKCGRGGRDDVFSEATGSLPTLDRARPFQPLILEKETAKPPFPPARIRLHGGLTNKVNP